MEIYGIENTSNHQVAKKSPCSYPVCVSTAEFYTMWYPYYKTCVGAKPNNKNYVVPQPATLSWHGRHRWLDQIQRLGCVLLLSVASYVVARHWIIESVNVAGISMQPTLADSGRYLVNRFVYMFRAPRVGEVVVIRDPIDGLLSVKRLMATPGDCIGFIDDRVILNGIEINEPYLQHHAKTGSNPTQDPEALTTLKFYLCKPNEYFVLGDNRPDSIDSRSYGPIRREDILGMVIY